jgi:hypothetical protein
MRLGSNILIIKNAPNANAAYLISFFIKNNAELKPSAATVAALASTPANVPDDIPYSEKPKFASNEPIKPKSSIFESMLYAGQRAHI